VLSAEAYAPAAVGKDIIWYLQATYYFLLVVYSNRVSLMHHLRVISTSLYVTDSDLEQFLQRAAMLALPALY